jgi:hypothetical protein
MSRFISEFRRLRPTLINVLVTSVESVPKNACVICYRNFTCHIKTCGPASSVGIATDYGLDSPGIESRRGEVFRACQNPLCGPPSLLYNGYWVFPGGKVRPGRDADLSPPSSAVVMKE